MPRSGRLPPLRGDDGTGSNAVIGSPALPGRRPTAVHKHGDRSHDGKGHPSFDKAHHLAVVTVPLTGKDGREPPLSSPRLLPSHTVHRISYGDEMSPALPAGLQVLILHPSCAFQLSRGPSKGRRISVGDDEIEDGGHFLLLKPETPGRYAAPLLGFS